MGRRSGEYYETKALHYLQQRGLKLIERNFTQKFGEIDLVMMDNATLVFVEVRFRTSLNHGHPSETITTSKQTKIKRCAERFLQRHTTYTNTECRFDAVCMTGKLIDWVKNAF